MMFTQPACMLLVKACTCLVEIIDCFSIQSKEAIVEYSVMKKISVE